MSRAGLLEDIVGDGREYRIIHDVIVPQVTLESIAKNRENCKTNVCKCYDTSWTCPPNCGSPEFCRDRVLSFKDADIYVRTYRNVDFSDPEAMDAMMDGFRQECREIMIECRKRGYDVMALADGPCKYCRRCARLDGKECYHPDMQVPSVSGYGVDMASYMKAIGEDFGFSKDAVSLYGLILFK